MEYKLCNDNMICCDDDCRRCANLVHEALTNENKSLKKTNKECLDKIEELKKTIDYLHGENIKLRNRNLCIDHKLDELFKEKAGLLDDIKRLAEERDRIHDELKELKSKKMVPLSEVYRIIAGHSDYHGNSILSALTCIAEGKEVGPVATYEYIWVKEKEFKALEKQLEWANENIESLNNKLFDDGCEILSKNQKIMELKEKCAKLEKENAKLDKECEKLHSDNQRLAHECRYYIERESNLVMENDKLRSENQMLEFQKKQLKEEFDTLTIESYKAVRNLEHDKALLQNECNRLSIDNKNLVHWNLRLTKERENVLISEEDDTNQCDVCSELSDKIEGLKEDIIRLDKCLSKRPCVKEERYGE